jgi:hypothetical protein
MASTELAPQGAPNERGAELDDGVDALQAKETAHAVPAGVWALFAGLVLWGVWYFAAYIGWDQAEDLKAATALSTNVAHTIAYTTIPAAVIVALALAMRRRKAGRR